MSHSFSASPPSSHHRTIPTEPEPLRSSHQPPSSPNDSITTATTTTTTTTTSLKSILESIEQCHEVALMSNNAGESSRDEHNSTKVSQLLHLHRDLMTHYRRECSRSVSSSNHTNNTPNGDSIFAAIYKSHLNLLEISLRLFPHCELLTLYYLQWHYQYAHYAGIEYAYQDLEKLWRDMMYCENRSHVANEGDETMRQPADSEHLMPYDWASSSPLLWYHFIDWTMHSSLIHFSLQNLRDLFQEAFTKLMNSQYWRSLLIAGRLDNTEKASSHWETYMMRLMYLYCHMEKQAGHSERGIALMQAMIELNSLYSDEEESLPTATEKLSLYWENRCSVLREFWESELPRVGEDNALGLAAFRKLSPKQRIPANLLHVSQEESLITTTSTDDTIANSSTKQDNGIRNFIHQQQQSLTNGISLPLKPVTHSHLAAQRPERIVLFSDLEPFLFPICDPSHQYHLIYMLLELVDVSIFYSQSSTNDEWVHHLMCQHEDTAHLFSNYSTNIMDWDSLFDWKPQKGNIWTHNHDIPYRFVKNLLLLSLRYHRENTLLALTLLDLEARFESHDAALKKAQRLLKHDRNNHLLWNYYAQHTYKSSAREKGRKTYDLALEMLTSSESDLPVSLISLLFRSYSEMELLSRDDANCVHILASMAEFLEFQRPFKKRDPQQNTASDSKRVTIATDIFRKLLQSNFSECFHQASRASDGNNHGDAVRNIELPMCAALFFHATGRTEEALRLLDICTQWPSTVKADTTEQYIFLSYIRFVRGILHRKVYEGSSISTICRFAERFPFHPLALSELCNSTSPLQIGLVRNTLESLVYEHSSPIIIAFSVVFEMKHSAYIDIAVLRSIFENAFLQHDHCVFLWRSYLRIEMKHGNPGRAKQVGFRALNACPAAKVLWVDGLTLLSEHFSETELKSIMDLMHEKELS